MQCGMDPYIILPEKAECVDQQTLKMQVGAATACELLAAAWAGACRAAGQRRNAHDGGVLPLW